MKWLNQKITLRILLTLLCLVFIASFFHKAFNIDEALIGEHAWWLSKGGPVRSEMADGLGLGIEKQQFHYHKLLVALGALCFKLFGLQLAPLRCISLLAFIVLCVLFWRYAKRHRQKDIGMITVLLLLCQANIFDYAFLFRPEMLLAALGFSSFLLMDNFFQEKKISRLIFSGMLAGACVLTHLNGLVFIGAGVGVLLLARQWKALVVFAGAALIVAALYFIDINTAAKFQAFRYQFSYDPTLEAQAHHWYTPLVKLANEHKRFFHSPKEISLTLLLLLSLASRWRKLRRTHSRLLLYLLFLIIGIGAIAHGKTAKYALIYYPFIALIAGIALSSLRLKHIAWCIGFGAVLIFYIIGQGLFIKKLFTEYDDIVTLNKSVAAYLPKAYKPRVLGYESFMYNELPYVELHSIFAFQTLYRFGLNQVPAQKDLYDFARRNRNEYILIATLHWPKDMLELAGWNHMKQGDYIEGYTVEEKNQRFAVLHLQ